MRVLSSRPRATMAVRVLSIFCCSVLAAYATAATAASGHGTVKVMYAGSLAHVMEKQVGPAFEKATGDRFQGYAAGSTKLANEIKGKVRQGDVFISAHAAVNKRLMGADNGGWVAWYATFMQSPLVIGYNPKSRFADALKDKPWYEVITQPGFTVGRTDAKLDPKGRLTVEAIDDIAKKKQQPKLKDEITSHSKVFPEETLVGRLQSGQLDAGFFYRGEAAAAGIPTVPIDPVELGAVYTVTQLNDAPDASAASDFIQFVLGPKGRSILKKSGFDVISPIDVSGDRDAVPGALKSVLHGG